MERSFASIETITPDNGVFVFCCFEGPDGYSMAGGLGTRITELSTALAVQGYITYLIFIGDPNQPVREERLEGHLILIRWAQWISKQHPRGVYDGEEQKLSEYTEHVPHYVYSEIVRPAAAVGKRVIILGEDWQTAEAICRISDILYRSGIRSQTLVLWNLNSLMSLHRINWERLNSAATLCTVSRYMKHKMWEFGVNPLVIPNGIPKHYLEPVDKHATKRLCELMHQDDQGRPFLFKIGRFDPDKRWMMAISSVARLKELGYPTTLIMRGGIEPHGTDVLHHASTLGLAVRDLVVPQPSVREALLAIEQAGPADIYNLRFFLPEAFVRCLYQAADATLANSGHEPFGLVGLEVMASRGIAVTGSTGEDYAFGFENALVTETDEPDELVSYLLYLSGHPAKQASIRRAGYQTARQFLWDHIIENLVVKLEFLLSRQEAARTRRDPFISTRRE